MRFSQKLQKLADDFRKDYLDSDDVRDRTVMDPDWTQQKVIIAKHRTMINTTLSHSFSSLPLIENTRGG